MARNSGSHQQRRSHKLRAALGAPLRAVGARPRPRCHCQKAQPVVVQRRWYSIARLVAALPVAELQLSCPPGLAAALPAVELQLSDTPEAAVARPLGHSYHSNPCQCLCDPFRRPWQHACRRPYHRPCRCRCLYWIQRWPPSSPSIEAPSHRRRRRGRGERHGFFWLTHVDKLLRNSTRVLYS